MPLVHITRPIPAFVVNEWRQVKANTGDIIILPEILARAIQNKRHGVIMPQYCSFCMNRAKHINDCQNCGIKYGKCSYCCFDDCKGCFCELKGADRNRKIEEFL